LHLRRTLAAIVLIAASAGSLACGALPFTDRPAAGYAYGSGQPLVVAVTDATGDPVWRTAIEAAESRYTQAAPPLQFQDSAAGANIVVTVRTYRDTSPPELRGYTFQPGVAAFVAVYDANGKACNFPPSPLPLNCNGEIARGDVYVNAAMRPGDDIEERRVRLLLHEFGHAMGLTRHSSSLNEDQLAARYGW
jgi:predicted Zn-dependent protease